MKKCKNLYDYIEMAKYDIILYLVLFLIIAGIVVFYYYKTKIWFYFFIPLVLFIVFLSKITTYINLLSIRKYLLNNNLIEKIGNIIYWNYRNYFLTDNYFIIKDAKSVDCFSYKDILEIYKEKKVVLKSKYSSLSEYLYIKLKNGNQYKILIDTTKFLNEDYKDITPILLEKNSNIKII